MNKCENCGVEYKAKGFTDHGFCYECECEFRGLSKEGEQ